MTMIIKEEKKKQICLMFYPSLYKKLGDLAMKTGRTRSQLAGWLLEKALERELKQRDENF